MIARDLAAGGLPLDWGDELPDAGDDDGFGRCAIPTVLIVMLDDAAREGPGEDPGVSPPFFAVHRHHSSTVLDD